MKYSLLLTACMVVPLLALNTLQLSSDEKADKVIKKSAFVSCDTRGHIIQKFDKYGEMTELTFHPTINQKIIKLARSGLTTAFDYNEKGDLIHANNTQGQDITLSYNIENTIQKMILIDSVEKSRRVLTFLYNNRKKPINITMVGVGAIDVEYDENDQITKVTSDKGAKIALQVTMAFQNLLTVTALSEVQNWGITE